MGNFQTYSKAQEHSRFSRIQYSYFNKSMIVQEPLQARSMVMEKWQEKRRHYRHIYNMSGMFLCQQYKIQSSLCNDNGIFMGKFNGHYKTTLRDEIEQRFSQRKYYQESEIWFLLLQVAKCAAHVYEYGENHFIGNIHPSNILIGHQRSYKIIVTNYSYSLPNQLDHFNEYKIKGNKSSFISPQLVGFLQSTKYVGYPEYPKCINKKKSESFCLGLTLLSMATLTLNMDKVYKFNDSIEKRIYKHKITLSSTFSNNQTSIPQSCQIDLQKKERLFNSKEVFHKTMSNSHFDNLINFNYLNTLLSIVKDKYSNILYDIIKSLLYPEPEIRKSILSLYEETLKNVEEYILNFDDKWVNSADRLLSYEIPSLPQESQEICSNWLICESRTMLSRLDSKLE